MSIQTIIGLSGIALLLSVTLLWILLALGCKKECAYKITLVFYILSFFPLSGYSINLYFRGLFNDLSITSLCFLSYYMLYPKQHKDIKLKHQQTLLLIIALTGLFFYPTALGFGPIDPYNWGFILNNQGFLIPLIFLSLIAALMLYAYKNKQLFMLLCLVLSVLAYSQGLMESRNLWDYLFDPLIVLYALWVTCYRFFSKHLTANKINI